MDASFSLNYNSVETLPGYEARAAFTVNSASVFKEDVDIVPTIVDDSLSYIPWGGDNQMPFDILNLIEKDETLATCQCFNAEVCYGSGLQYTATEASAAVKSAVEDFTLDNDLASYFLGVSQDFKHFGFAVSVLILNEEGTKIVRLLRKEACYCRFTPADKHGRISKILYANWRKAISSRNDIEEIDLLDPASPWQDLQERLRRSRNADSGLSSGASIPTPQSAIRKNRKFAIVSRIPTVDSTYYPIPYYGALFRGKWYNIKQFIGIAKEAKLKNSAPIKYHSRIAGRVHTVKTDTLLDRRDIHRRVLHAAGMENTRGSACGVSRPGVPVQYRLYLHDILAWTNHLQLQRQYAPGSYRNVLFHRDIHPYERTSLTYSFYAGVGTASDTPQSAALHHYSHARNLP